MTACLPTQVITQRACKITLYDMHDHNATAVAERGCIDWLEYMLRFRAHSGSQSSAPHPSLASGQLCLKGNLT